MVLYLRAFIERIFYALLKNLKEKSTLDKINIIIHNYYGSSYRNSIFKLYNIYSIIINAVSLSASQY